MRDSSSHLGAPLSTGTVTSYYDYEERIYSSIRRGNVLPSTEFLTAPVRLASSLSLGTCTTFFPVWQSLWYTLILLPIFHVNNTVANMKLIMPCLFTILAFHKAEVLAQQPKTGVTGAPTGLDPRTRTIPARIDIDDLYRTGGPAWSVAEPCSSLS